MQFVLKIFALAFAIGFASCITDGEPYSESWSIANGATVPDFSATASDGQVFSSETMAGKRAVIVFFNTDCSDCRRELPEMQVAYESTLNDYQWIAIGREQDPDKAAQYWADNKLTIPCYASPDRKIYSLFASEGIPRVYVTDNMTIIAQLAPDELQNAGSLIKILTALI